MGREASSLSGEFAGSIRGSCQPLRGRPPTRQFASGATRLSNRLFRGAWCQGKDWAASVPLESVLLQASSQCEIPDRWWSKCANCRYATMPLVCSSFIVSDMLGYNQDSDAVNKCAEGLWKQLSMRLDYLQPGRYLCILVRGNATTCQTSSIWRNRVHCVCPDSIAIAYTSYIVTKRS